MADHRFAFCALHFAFLLAYMRNESRGRCRRWQTPTFILPHSPKVSKAFRIRRTITIVLDLSGAPRASNVTPHSSFTHVWIAGSR
jgi:hypothetical protein